MIRPCILRRKINPPFSFRTLPFLPRAGESRECPWQGHQQSDDWPHHFTTTRALCPPAAAVLVSFHQCTRTQAHAHRQIHRRGSVEERRHDLLIHSRIWRRRELQGGSFFSSSVQRALFPSRLLALFGRREGGASIAARGDEDEEGSRWRAGARAVAAAAAPPPGMLRRRHLAATRADLRCCRHGPQRSWVGNFCSLTAILVTWIALRRSVWCLQFRLQGKKLWFFPSPRGEFSDFVRYFHHTGGAVLW